MKIDIQEIPYSQFKPNHLVVVRVSSSQMRENAFESIVQGFRKIDPSIKVLIMSSDITLETVPEETMNRAGWFRKTSDS